MWLEIIVTAVATATATHLGPQAYSFLKGKFVKVKVTEPVSPPLGNYIVAVDSRDGEKTFRLKIAPAIQKTRLGGHNNNPQPSDLILTSLKPKKWTEEEMEAEIAEAAKDREFTEEEIAAYTARSADPYSELDLTFEPLSEKDHLQYDPSVGVIPPDYDGKPSPEVVAEYNAIARAHNLKTRA